MPPGGNGSPDVAFTVRVEVETAAGQPLRCLTSVAGTPGTAGPITLSDGPFYVSSACDTDPSRSPCLAIDQGVGSWTISGPLLMLPPPVTVTVKTGGKPIVRELRVQVRVENPPAAG